MTGVAIRSLPVIAPPGPRRLCESTALQEKGVAVLFDVLHFREPARAFALHHGGVGVWRMKLPSPAMRQRRWATLRYPG